MRTHSRSQVLFALLTVFISWNCAERVQAQSLESFAVPYETTDVATSESGKIADVLVKEGQTVQPGDVLMVLDSRVLEISREIAEFKTKMTAKKDAATVEMKVKKQRYEKLKELLEQGHGNTQEVKRAEADYLIAEASLQTVEEELQQSKKELARIDAQIEHRKIRSPIAGVVLHLHKTLGEYVSTTEPKVASVVELDRLKVTFYMPTAQALSLQTKDRLSVRFPLTGQTADVIVDFISPVTNAESGTVRVVMVIANSQGTYRSGTRCQLLPLRTVKR